MRELKHKKTSLTSRGYVEKMAKELKARGFEFVLIVDDKRFTYRAVSRLEWGLGAMSCAERAWMDWHFARKPPTEVKK